MKPPRFDYHDPTELAAALQLLAEHGDAAKILAGGQSLVPVLNMRLARPALLVDIGRLGELSYIREEDGRIAIGALTRQRSVERSELVRRRCPLLADATRWIAHPQIRNRGTIGGSLSHHDPAAELATIATVLDAEIVLTSQSAQRTVQPVEFFLTYFTTTARPDEMLTEVRFPVLQPGTGWAFVEVARRHGDFALVSVAAVVRLDEAGKVAAARIALSGVGGAPVRAGAAEAALAGQVAGDATIAAAADLARRDLDCDSDIHASAAFRTHLAGVLTERALRQALARATGGETA